MTRAIRLLVVMCGLLVAQVAMGQATPPAGSTGICKDGTYSTAPSKQGACRGHKGVQQWYAASATPAAATTPTTVPAAAASASTSVAASSATSSSAKASPAAKAAARPQAAGGDPGLVWVNSSSNVYHCYGTDFYGKTKAGSYMSEADAKAKGAHADHGKPCSK
jgi:Protein of unknown function (DUF3761)